MADGEVRLDGRLSWDIHETYREVELGRAACHEYAPTSRFPREPAVGVQRFRVSAATVATVRGHRCELRRMRLVGEAAALNISTCARRS